MSDFIFVILIVIAFIFIAVVWLRIRSPHSRKMLNEQYRINTKNKTVLDANTANGKSSGISSHGWIKPVVLTTLFIIVGGALLYMTYDTHIVVVSAWGWSHVLFSLILWGVLSALLSLNEKTLGTATKTLKNVLAMIMIVIFVVFPTGVWISSIGHSHTKHVHASKPKHTINVLRMPPNGDSRSLNARYGYAMSFTGKGFETHCVYTDGHEGIITTTRNTCHSGGILYSYAHDNSGKKNSVLYKFNKVF